jgi:outer membrane protein assembly factor BamB
MSPIIIDGLCIAHLGEKTGGTIVAYDLNSGRKKWTWTGDTPAYASPVLMTIDGEKLLAIETEQKVLLMKVADGSVLWQTDFRAQGWSYNASTPVVDGDTLIYCAQGRGTTAVKLEKHGDTFAASQLWKNTHNSPQFCTPVLKNNLLFGLSNHGDFYCINAQSGQTVWTEENGGHGAFGSIIDAGSVLLALTPKSELMVLEPSGKQFRLIASIKVADTPTLSYPVVSGNHLYIEDQNSVALWKID